MLSLEHTASCSNTRTSHRRQKKRSPVPAGLSPKTQSTSFYTARSHTISAYATCPRMGCQTRFGNFLIARSVAEACYDFSRRHEYASNHGPAGSRVDWATGIFEMGFQLQTGARLI